MTKDSNGNELNNGDSVIVIKDLKVKGSSSGLKRGTKLKNIRLSNNEAEIESGSGKNCVVVKTQFVKKA